MLEFVNPWLLWGVLLGAVPLLIHFLQRRAWHEEPWGAMLFLQAAARRRQRRSRIESVLLLCVRCLIPVLAAVALSQPIVSDIDAPSETSERKHWVFLLDRSGSMRAVEGERSRFEMARESLLQLVDTARPGDTLTLWGINTIAPAEIVPQPTRDRLGFEREVRNLSATFETAHPARVLSELFDRLQEFPEDGDRQVVVLSDFCGPEWEVDSAADHPVVDALLRLADVADVTLVDVTEEHIRNVTLTSFRVAGGAAHTSEAGHRSTSTSTSSEASEPSSVTGLSADVEVAGRASRRAVTVNQPAMLEVILTCSSSTGVSRPAPDSNSTADSRVSPERRTLQILVEGREVHATDVELAPDERLTLRIPWTPLRSGPHRLSARLTSDALEIDDHRECVVNVKERLHVLVIDGHPGTGTSRFVELALNPWSTLPPAALDLETPLSLATAGPDRLLRGEFAGVDVLILCGVPAFSGPEVNHLRRFMESGGGVILGMGSDIDLHSYSRWVFHEEGFFSATVRDLVGDSGVTGEPFQFVARQVDHPILARFGERPRAALLTSRVYRYLAIELAPNTSAEPILSYSSGDPALIEASLGRGRCLVVTTSLDDRWGSWVLWPSFVPLLHEMVHYVAGGELDSQSALVGSVEVRWPPTQSGLVQLNTQDANGGSVPTRIVADQRGMHGSIGPLERPGWHTLLWSTEQGVWEEALAVGIDPAEGSLRQADLSQLDGVHDRVHIVPARDWQPRVSSSVIPAEKRNVVSLQLLIAVLCLVLIEPILARSFLWGVFLLGGMSALLLVRWGVFWLFV